MFKVCIVEDDENLRELLLLQLKRCKGFTCIAAFDSGEAALRDLPRPHPDIVLMDIKLPGMSGIECTQQLRQHFPRLDILMLTERDDSGTVLEALKAGANGYLLRSHTTVPELQKGMDELMRGGSPMTSAIARKVVDYLQRFAASPAIEKLTNREREVLECLAQGWLYKEIADRLEISIETARNHVRNIYRKLQVKSRTEAAVKYLRSRK